MAVSVKRHADGAVSETLLHYLRVDALPQQQRGVAMSKIMEPNPWYTCSCDHAAEISLGDVVGVQRLPRRLTATRSWSSYTGPSSRRWVACSSLTVRKVSTSSGGNAMDRRDRADLGSFMSSVFPKR